ncbi:MAG TPA: DnaA regulatory inactivator Hda [Oceanospirillaceae bacterium]|nr:DnaA regulatory inactivator Hda [Oceanospirillaceae bacterium]
MIAPSATLTSAKSSRIGSPQLTLGVTLNAQQQLGDFNFSGAPALSKSLQTLVLSQQGECLYLYGQTGVGKSHVLQGCVLLAQEASADAVFISGKELLKIPAQQASECLAGLESVSLLCIDDLDQLIVNLDWAQAWFHLYNQLMQRGGCIVVSSNKSPRQVDCALEDLRSRLQLANVFQLQPLDDDGCALMLQTKAKQKGLELSDELVAFVLARSARGLPNLLAVLDQLDAASWHEKRRITIPFVKQVMGW